MRSSVARGLFTLGLLCNCTNLDSAAVIHELHEDMQTNSTTHRYSNSKKHALPPVVSTKQRSNSKEEDMISEFNDEGSRMEVEDYDDTQEMNFGREDDEQFGIVHFPDQLKIGEVNQTCLKMYYKIHTEIMKGCLSTFSNLKMYFNRVKE